VLLKLVGGRALTRMELCRAASQEKKDLYAFLLTDESLSGEMEGREEGGGGAGVRMRGCAVRFGDGAHCPHSSGQEADGTRPPAYCGAASRFPLFTSIFLQQRVTPILAAKCRFPSFSRSFLHCLPCYLLSKHSRQLY
jgi:hypothetical protein